ncbi:hypothetical protein KEJ34_03370 [Candidatus Bathyarchaeota archaeon]|nr:hypothetical protein [Candidatus Bathyarchaeota archaeon]
MTHRVRSLSSRSIILHVPCILFAVLIQYALIESFAYAGLEEIVLLEIPIGGGFQIGILFHLIPLNVILVLYYSWIYLMRYRTVGLTEAARRKTAAEPKAAKKVESPKNIIRRLWSDFTIPMGITAFFALLLLTSFALLCPSVLNNFAASLYRGNNIFRGLISWFFQINSSLMGAVGLLAASFRISLESSLKPAIKSILGLDLAWKYLLCQNTAAWATVLYMLAYVKYYGIRRRR